MYGYSLIVPSSPLHLIWASGLASSSSLRQVLTLCYSAFRYLCELYPQEIALQQGQRLPSLVWRGVVLQQRPWPLPMPEVRWFLSEH